MDDDASHHQLLSFPLQVSFDHGYFLTVRAIQELRDKKRGSVSVGIGGPSGSGKSRFDISTEELEHQLKFIMLTQPS